MAEVVAEFFSIIGVDPSPPSNLNELIPYLMTVIVGVVLVCAVFAVLGKLGEVVLNFSRWK